MNGTLQVRVFEGPDLVFTEEFDGPVELGRRGRRAEALHARKNQPGRWRLAIAGTDDPDNSARHALVEPSPDGGVRLSNTSAKRTIWLSDGSELAPGASGTFPLPVSWNLGQKRIEIRSAVDESEPFRGLSEAALCPSQFTSAGPQAPRLPCIELPEEVKDDAVELFLRTLHPIVMVLQSANRSSDFFKTAARAVVEALGLDSGSVILRSQGRWRSVAHHASRLPRALAEPTTPSAAVADHHRAKTADTWRAYKPLFEQLVREKRTLWRDYDHESGEGARNHDRDNAGSVVAAPILDARSEVIGAIYGERWPCAPGYGGTFSPRIRRADAMLLEMLAGSVASGLSRIELEKAAISAKVRFEQFFTPELADELAARPDLLRGREVEVTMLFCDLRGFSRISERIGPARTVEWIGDVLGALSDCVIDHRGVLVDYLGDELIAMWGAPKPAPDHASLACRAALGMIDCLPSINAKWQPILGEATDLGIGVNTGPAQVGNTGTNRKFKYGALGNTVNLASRVQGATRYLKTRLVVTGSTRAQLDDGFATRHLGKASVVHITEPVELHEVVATNQPGWTEVRDAYEKALAQLDSRDFAGAIRTLGTLLADHPDDGPSLVLMSRAVDAVVADPLAFDPVWKLPGK
jgi:adenylate cyclase